MKKIILCIALFACFNSFAQEGITDLPGQSEQQSTSVDTSINNRLSALEQRIVAQEKKLRLLQNENLELKQQVAQLNAAKKQIRKNRKYVVSRTGSKQLVLDTSDGKRETHDAVRWENLKR